MHNTDGGWMEVRTGSNGMAQLHVANSGRVIPQTSVDELFVPLHRSDADRMHVPEQGFGLGLAIVKAVAEAHHGWVRAEPLAEGGLAIDVTLPPFTPGLPRRP
jgi:signal transduction histidine kinase